MALQVIALVLAFFIRKVKVKGLDDSKYIAAAIYITSIVLAVIIVLTYSLKGFINVFAVVFSTGFLTGTTVILLLVFVPLVSIAACIIIHGAPGKFPPPITNCSIFPQKFYLSLQNLIVLCEVSK